MSSLEANHLAFEKLDTVAVGISVDSTPCKNAWAKSLGIERTRLLSDFWPHGALADSLGIFKEKEGISERANILLDEKSKIIFMKIYPIGELPDIEEVIHLLRSK